MQKLKKQQDTLLAEYDRVKNRNYKRFERGEWKLPGDETEKDMSFEQVYRMADAGSGSSEGLSLWGDFRGGVWKHDSYRKL